MHFPNLILKESNPYYASLANMCVIGISDVKDNPDVFDMNIYILNNTDFTEPFTINGVKKINIINWYNDIAYLVEYVEYLIEEYKKNKTDSLEYIINGLCILLLSIKRYWCVFICTDRASEPALIGSNESILSELSLSTNIRNYITATTGKIFDKQLYTDLRDEIQGYTKSYLIKNGNAVIN